ncbi:pleckstrin homology domain-containing family A member 2 isoform X3 [Marmota monax]|uniref:pleckstrin homology domain-containing family A member 2 isoform X3 n=1 Tax=Marmota monax TaxID=9995 RepID=UPI0026EEAA05|nr:pleckstrin homology domain-containing family A member 2 isoform X3 [Marmota monax]
MRLSWWLTAGEGGRSPWRPPLPARRALKAAPPPIPWSVLGSQAAKLLCRLWRWGTGPATTTRAAVRKGEQRTTQNLAVGAGAVGSLQLTYISKVPKGGSLPLATEVLKSLTTPAALDKKPQVAYKTEIIGGVVVHTPISQNGGDGQEGSEPGSHAILRRSQSYIPTSGCRASTGPPLIKSGYCVKQGNVRKSWKRRFFALDDFTICYFKCEQDREPLRTIYLKDVLKTHECLVKSGDLLMRDNLFEIITSSRTFYIQADSPEDMHSWIKEIGTAVQALKCHPRDISFSRSISLTRPGSSSFTGGPNSVFCRGRPPVEEKKTLCKAPSVASAWQPWTPVPQAGEKLLPAEETPEDSLFMPRLGESSTAGVLSGSRIRHRSEPQHPKEKPFVFNLDDENIRTSDV